MKNPDRMQIVQYCQILLKHFIAIQKKRSGTNMLSDLHLSWKKLALAKRSRYFYVKTDITDAFGSVKQVRCQNLNYFLIILLYLILYIVFLLGYSHWNFK